VYLAEMRFLQVAPGIPLLKQGLAKELSSGSLP
jgi:hypothetical protein